MSSGDQGWEQRMADRAKARERIRRERDPVDRREAYERRNPELPWLNGYRRDDLRHAWVVGTRRCIGCGGVTGCAAYVLEEGAEYPPEPVWPFTMDACPVCLGSEVLTTLQVDLGEPGSTRYPRTELRELRDE
jgi:hypothetical protein